MVHTDAMVNTLTLPRRIQYVLPATMHGWDVLLSLPRSRLSIAILPRLSSHSGPIAAMVHTEAMVHTYNVTATGRTRCRVHLRRAVADVHVHVQTVCMRIHAHESESCGSDMNRVG